ncbi:DUF302 domain-containing protein [Congregibacter sp.]|uniref:DUF302 domain-containing protein n=1 Tax=Congregibacter sp. TaxID=2744308 RepID=UPI003858A99B
MIAIITSAILIACGGERPIDTSRYAAIDSVVGQIKENLAAADDLREIADIDHSRLAHEAESPMPPARVVIFSNPELETSLIQENPLTALDLPLRALTFEDSDDGSPSLIYNSFDYLLSRYGLNPEDTLALRKRYEQSFATAVAGVSSQVLTQFASDVMQPDGIVTIDSPFDFEETIERVNEAINAQGDTVHFGVVDFRANAAEVGVSILPSHMILFGGPGPGGKAMASALTLGLDGFCQKFLIWQDQEGVTHLSFNDLLALAERQGVSKAPALRVINFRLKKTFGDALAVE